MILRDAIDMIALYKEHSLDERVILRLINQIEARICTEIMLLSPLDVVQYDVTKLDSVLIAPPPHDEVYIAYAVAMIDHINGEYDKYAVTLSYFNEIYTELERWFSSVYSPADGFRDEAKRFFISAYGIAVKNGFKGTEEEWLASLIGERGAEGKSAYDTARELGFDGTEEEWLDSLVGERGEIGADGKSAYEIAKEFGFDGTEEEWLASLPPQKYVDYWTEEDKQSIVDDVIEGIDFIEKIPTSNIKGFSVFSEGSGSDQNNAYYVLEAYGKTDQIHNTQGTGIYDMFDADVSMGVAIYTPDKVVILPVVGMWPQPGCPDFSKFGLSVDVKHFVKNATHIAFVKYLDAGSDIRNEAPPLICGEGHRTTAKNGLVTGVGNILYEYNSNAVGTYNAPKNSVLWYVGNGTDDENRSNALEVYEDGHAEIGMTGDSPNSLVTRSFIEEQIGDIDTALDDKVNTDEFNAAINELSNEIMPSETYDFKNTYHEYNEYDGGYSRRDLPYSIGDIITIFVPMGWCTEIIGTSIITITATEKDEVYKFTVDENTNIYHFDAALNSGEDFDPSDCPVIITKARNRLEDIEAQIGDIDTALDELHEYAQALITGGGA